MAFQFLRKVIATAKGVGGHPLHAGAGLKAVCRFGLVQLTARLVPGDICVWFPNQTRLLVPPRMKGAVHFIVPGLCEFEPMSFVAHYLRPEDLFVDVGANLGAFTILASGVAGARSIAIEPSPSSFHYLRQNIRLNQLEEIATPVNTALGSEPGTLHLTEGLGTENHLCLDGAAPGRVEVQVATLDQVLESRNPTLIKIDVEGYEPEVMAGAARTLRFETLQALIIERAENAGRYALNESKPHEEIRALGFVPCRYDPRRRVLERLPADALGTIIYIKNLEAAAERLRAASPFQFGTWRI